MSHQQSTISLFSRDSLLRVLRQECPSQGTRARARRRRDGKSRRILSPSSEATPLHPPSAQRPLCRVTRCYPSCRDIPIMTGDDAVNGSEGNRIVAARETLGL